MTTSIGAPLGVGPPGGPADLLTLARTFGPWDPPRGAPLGVDPPVGGVAPGGPMDTNLLEFIRIY